MAYYGEKMKLDLKNTDKWTHGLRVARGRKELILKRRNARFSLRCNGIQASSCQLLQQSRFKKHGLNVTTGVSLKVFFNAGRT